mmetsp:Transcript_55634/g.172610  ORF Transcript_55634/g.172610 Transcript_55634/m.172610 type:complete len:253 (+) Transcript_55634:1054-1812(+)
MHQGDAFDKDHGLALGPVDLLSNLQQLGKLLGLRGHLRARVVALAGRQVGAGFGCRCPDQLQALARQLFPGCARLEAAGRAPQLVLDGLRKTFKIEFPPFTTQRLTNVHGVANVLFRIHCVIQLLKGLRYLLHHLAGPRLDQLPVARQVLPVKVDGVEEVLGRTVQGALGRPDCRLHVLLEHPSPLPEVLLCHAPVQVAGCEADDPGWRICLVNDVPQRSVERVVADGMVALVQDKHRDLRGPEEARTQRLA